MASFLIAVDRCIFLWYDFADTNVSMK